MNSNFIELKNIWYDIDQLRKISLSIPHYNWYSFSCNNVRWTVKEKVQRYRLECKNIEPHPLFDDFFRFFSGRLSYDRLLFSKTPPPGVPRHIDRTRQTIINFPILGHFFDSPQSFWSDYVSEKPNSQFHYSKNELGFYYPVQFNGQAIHSVENATDEERTILSIWFDIPQEEFNLNSIIDHNYRSTYIKVIS